MLTLSNIQNSILNLNDSYVKKFFDKNYKEYLNCVLNGKQFTIFIQNNSVFLNTPNNSVNSKFFNNQSFINWLKQNLEDYEMYENESHTYSSNDDEYNEYDDTTYLHDKLDYDRIDKEYAY